MSNVRLRQAWREMVRQSFSPRQWFEDGDRPEEFYEGPDLSVRIVNVAQEGRFMWVYREADRADAGSCWQVGYYDPDGQWHQDRSFEAREDAARRVHYLNGGV